jgi:peptidoglycan/LPS O-acetylase OafA/YrhL
VFFVISGYLITALVIQDHARGEFSLLNFYERRARRILPALFLVMAACIPVAWLMLLPGDMRDFAQSLAATSLFNANHHFWRKSGYFDTAAELKPLLHAWSLAVEEQYYLIFPFYFLAIWRFGRRAYAAATLALLALSLTLAELTVQRYPAAAFFLLPMRAWELALGSLVAVHMTGAGAPRDGIVPQVLSALGLAMIAASVALFDRHTPFPGVFALVPTLGACCVILFARPGTLAFQLLAWRPLVFVGLISYSAYLWHQPLLAFMRHRVEGGLSLSASVLAIALTFLLAVLSWRLVERPARDRAMLGRRAVFGGSVALGLAFIGFGALGHVTNGFLNQRLSPEQAAALQTAVRSPRADQCHTGGPDYLKPAESCVYHEGRLAYAVFGDSHAVEIAFALAEELRPRALSLRHLTFSGCPPTFGGGGRPHDQNCRKWTAEAIAFLGGRPEIGTVVVSYRIHWALFGEHGGVYPDLPDTVDAGLRQARWESYIAILRALVGQGKKVVLVLQAPELPLRIEGLVMAARDVSQGVLGVPRDWWDRRRAFVMSRLSEIPPEVRVVDPSIWLCDGAACAATKAGKALYFDDNHLSVEGARVVARKVLD